MKASEVFYARTVWEKNDLRVCSVSLRSRASFVRRLSVVVKRANGNCNVYFFEQRSNVFCSSYYLMRLNVLGRSF